MRPHSGEDRDLERLRTFVSKLPGVVETSSWGHANWRTGKKLFASYEENRGKKVFSFFAGVEGAEAYLEDRRFSPPKYTDHHGWVSLELGAKTDWNEVRSLLNKGFVLAGAEPKKGDSPA